MASSPDIHQAPIERLGLSPRSQNALKRANLTRVGEVLEISDEDLVNTRNFGDKCLEELYRKLAERGISRHPGNAPESGGKGKDF